MTDKERDGCAFYQLDCSNSLQLIINVVVMTELTWSVCTGHLTIVTNKNFGNLTAYFCG